MWHHVDEEQESNWKSQVNEIEIEIEIVLWCLCWLYYLENEIILSL